MCPFKSIGNEIGVDPNVILQTSHGRRSIDILKDIDPSKANWECQFFQLIFIILSISIKSRFNVSESMI